ncbi:MAG: DNA helicase RecQ, partial [Chitinivibrionales bacterium]|nr:DNA helicase RecQ [Chitinivibrionales bacterium]MBD3357840.1 DNA helicase RecQ [Chitinivibrionales bacterium]
EVLGGRKTVTIIHHEAPKKQSRAKSPAAENSELFEILRSLRTRLAREQGIPPYMVFADRTLRDMASCMPSNEQEMLMVTGVGDAKFSRYGEMFLEEIAGFSSGGADSDQAR